MGRGRERLVGAFNVNGGNLCPHGSQISRELPAMVDGMADREIQIGDGGIIQEADVVNRGGEVFARQRFEAWQALREVFIVPAGNVSARL